MKLQIFKATKKAALISLFFLLGPLAASAATSTQKVNLPVPFLWEIPDGRWVAPWSGACEEASIMAVEGFYLKKAKKIVPRVEAKAQMSPLFEIENRIFGYNSDTDGKEIVKLINDYTSFDAFLKEEPTLEDIKEELYNGHPVITLHYGYDLNNPRHRFRRGGSSYHVMALTGFDDKTSEFFVNDSELSDGIDFRYKYDTILSTLHDFDHKTKQANGPARAVFTREKTIYKGTGSSRIYLIRDGKKHYIAAPSVFKNHRWSWSLVKTVDKSILDGMENGPAIIK